MAWRSTRRGKNRLGPPLSSGSKPSPRPPHKLSHCQWFQWSAKGSVDGLGQPPVHRDGLAHERERIGPSAEHPYRLYKKRWFHIDDPVSETLAGTCASIVDLIRI